MEINVTDIPKSIKKFAFSPKIILSEKTTVEFLIRMKEYIFSVKCCEAAEKIGINVFDLVFIGEKTFGECCEMYLNRIREHDFDIVRTAFLLKKLYNREYVRISGIMCENDKAYVREPEYTYLRLLSEDQNERGKDKYSGKKLGFSKRSRIMLDTVRLAAVKYGMKNTIQYKELIDKYNFRRFSSNLRINNRPASLDDVNAVLSAKKNECLTDLSDTKNRICFSALYAIAYGGFGLSDLYDKDTVFDITGLDKERKLSDLSSDLINIIYNGNGIEIANMFIHIITVFSQSKLPPVNMRDLGKVMDYYPMYYAAASLASVCESIFKYDGLNGELRQYIKKHTLENYWTSMDRLLLMKQYAVVVTFCYKLAHFDPELYIEDPGYQGEILYAFENADKFAKELEKNG